MFKKRLINALFVVVKVLCDCRRYGDKAWRWSSYYSHESIDGSLWSNAGHAQSPLQRKISSRGGLDRFQEEHLQGSLGVPLHGPVSDQLTRSEMLAVIEVANFLCLPRLVALAEQRLVQSFQGEATGECDIGENISCLLETCKVNEKVAQSLVESNLTWYS